MRIRYGFFTLLAKTKNYNNRFQIELMQPKRHSQNKII